MKHLWFACLSLMLVLALPMEAEAKRFGGGFSLGKSFSTQKKVAPAPTKQQSATAPGAAAAPAAAKPGMGGLFGGLLAGGLLGALLFGGAFDGIQMMDILLIGLVLFVMFKLLASRRQAAYAGAAGMNQEPAFKNTAQAFESTQTPGAAVSESDVDSSDSVNIPDWFDADAFVAQAPQHFEQLQAAWDKQDWIEIAEYTSAELLAQLKTNRSVLPEGQHTEVVSCMADIVGFHQGKAETVVSVNFHGWLRENQDEQTTEFSEIWHLSRVSTVAGVNWVIVGIEQA